MNVTRLSPPLVFEERGWDEAMSTVPEWVLDLSVVEGVNHDLSDDVAERDHEEGEQEKHDRVEEGVECQRQ